MLSPYSAFKEAIELRVAETETKPYILPLKSDNPEAFAAILYAIHLQSENVPKHTQNFDQLVNLAIICDKYDCATAMGHWKEKWVAQWRDKALVLGYERWLFVAWTFGVTGVCTQLSRQIIL